MKKVVFIIITFIFICIISGCENKSESPNHFTSPLSIDNVHLTAVESSLTEGFYTEFILSADNVHLTAVESSLTEGFYTEFILSANNREISFNGMCRENRINEKLSVADITGDGMPDIVAIFNTGGGTGTNTEEIHIFDGVTLEKYEISDVMSILKERVKCSADEKKYYLKIDGSEYTIDKSLLETTPDKLGDEPYFELIHYYYEIESSVVAIVPIQVGMSEYYGHLQFLYEFQDGVFHVSDITMLDYNFDYVEDADELEFPVYEIPLSAYMSYSYDDSRLLWQPIKENVYPDEFFISLDTDKDLMLKIEKRIEDDIINYVIPEIHLYSNIMTCDPPLAYLERSFCIYQNIPTDQIIIGNMYVETFTEPRIARWLYITPDFVDFIENTPEIDGYEITFYHEDGKMMYKKTNTQYLYIIQASNLLANAFISVDDFFMETGIVTNSDDQIIYNPIKSYTVGEWYLSDDFYFKEEREKFNAATIDEYVYKIFNTVVEYEVAVLYTEHEPPIIGYGARCAVPDFFDEEQVDLYRRAVSVFPVFSGVPDVIESFPMYDGTKYKRDSDLIPIQVEEHEYMNFLPVNGRYKKWEDFESMGLSVFTKEYFETLSEYFLNIDGQLYYRDSAMGGQFGYAPDKQPDRFELISKTENAVEFNLIGHYYQDGFAILDDKGPINTLSFLIKMEMTEDGWRFSQFNSAG